MQNCLIMLLTGIPNCEIKNKCVLYLWQTDIHNGDISLINSDVSFVFLCFSYLRVCSIFANNDRPVTNLISASTSCDGWDIVAMCFKLKRGVWEVWVLTKRGGTNELDNEKCWIGVFLEPDPNWQLKVRTTPPLYGNVI